ncbi:hypothetical protein [Pseudoalteromonas marina]|uniref:Dodecin domain-containing protein n=1 Tax=Pseudoalteromonas marina TaxID=267375 RepID=A0ABT9FI38_9GAMM|nr:hypothetical protein [Pseudoalteromonas marina]MDP2566457.1 hypothetical protein [Pseudoalteromonas marina]
MHMKHKINHMTDSVNIFSAGADSEEMLELLIGDIHSNYHIDKADLLSSEDEVDEKNIRKFKVTITIEEVKGESNK